MPIEKKIPTGISMTMYGYAIAFLLLLPQFALAEIYKYKDANGKWQFTDKKPKGAESEVIGYKNSEQKQQGPSFNVQQVKGVNYLMVQNPFHAPLMLRLESEQLVNGKKEWLVPAQKSMKLFQSQAAIKGYRYRWQLGDPNVSAVNQRYHFPVQTQLCTHISQSFNGRFSHNKDHSRYAVDIAMDVGTPIVAAREGVVVGVKDDYHMGGVNEYFLDKANYVSVIHNDGTFAGYFHILLGTAVVKPGDKVDAGQLLARSGSSGFSSGPHLHFVIYRNKGFKQLSIPFQFVTKNENIIEPTEGLKICDQLIP